MSDAGGETLPETKFRFDVVGGDEGDWQVVYLHASEKLSRCYEGTLLLAHPLPAPDASALMGKHVGVEVSRGAGGRNLRGLVRRVESMGSTGSYGFVKLTVVPELWTLSLRQNSRIWQDVPVATIVRDVLRDAGLYQGDGGFEVAPSVQAHPPREYCVQYKESDLAFVSRLLEEEGIPFGFKHEGEKEGLVLAGKDHAWPPVPTLDGSGKVPVLDAGAATHAVESAQWFNAVKQMKPAGAMLRDFDFTHPDAVLDMTKASVGEAAKHVVYEFPARFTLGGYDGLLKAYGKHAGEQWAKIRGEQLRADAETAAGQSNVTGLLPGMRLTLAGHEESGSDGDQVVVGVEHHALAAGDFPDELWSSERFKGMLRTTGVPEEELAGPRPPRARYHNRFTSVAAGVTWRPQREEKRPVISGPQTAMVMAQPGSDEEICVDEHGRVLVRFHWERPDQRGSAQTGKNASCWVRVAQSWAGVAWGAMFIPRVGMEVVVQFLDGDPDRPLVTGCVYNGKNPPPYELPKNKTRSTFKSLSSPGGDGYNELRFEDLKGKEQVWVHAERDHDVVVKNDATMRVGHDRTHTVEHDEQLTVFNDRAASVRRNDSLEVEGYRSVAVHGGGGLSVQVDAKYRLNADAGVLITCGASSIEMLPDRVTVSSKTVNVVGSSLVNINGKLVKINCDAAPTPAKSDVVGVMATKALSMVGTPGGVLDKVKGLIDPKKLAGGFAGKLSGLLKKLGIPERIMKRLQGLAEGVVGELLSALKEGRAPNWGKIGEQAIGAAVGIAVGEVFRPLESIGVVQGNKLLAGLVDEAKKSAETAATYGVLHAAGLNEGMARDPFWQVMKERHGAAWKGLLTETAKEAGGALLDAITGPRSGAAAGGVAGAGVQRVAMEAGVEAGMGQVTGGAGGAGGAAGGGGADQALGGLSRRYESGNRGPGTIAHTPGDAGGASYGTYQIATNTGTMSGFLQHLGTTNPNYRQALGNAAPGSAAFDQAWGDLARSDPEGFGAAQHDFIRATHYDAARDRITQRVPGLDVENRSGALRDVLWSTSVQHGAGGAANVFDRAVGSDDPARLSDEEIIRRVYAERGADGGQRYFPSSSQGVRNSVVNRFEDEQRDALEMLARERGAR